MSKEISHPRHGKWDKDVEIYRRGEWIVAPLSSVIAGDAFQILEYDDNGEVLRVDRCFLSKSGAKVNHHPVGRDGSRKDPDIVIGDIEMTTRTEVVRTYTLSLGSNLDLLPALPKPVAIGGGPSKPDPWVIDI